MPKIKVAIIGAGASGFAVSEVLRSEKYHKYFDVTMFERNSYVGGKCCTVSPDGEISNGRDGGYELGAVIVSEHAKGYADLIKLLDKYDIKRSVFNPHGSEAFVHIDKGKIVDINKVPFKRIRVNPRRFWKIFKGYDRFLKDYFRFTHSRHVGYVGRPKALNKNASKLYRHEIIERLSGVIQGYGYADIDDKKLTPPLLYYHQLEVGEITFPLHKIDIGTQGIWAKIASHYPKGAIRLNETVTKIERDSFGVKVFTAKGVDHYDYLVVATPLKPALNFLDIDQEEKKFLTKMKHNNFVTILGEVEGINHPLTFNARNCTHQKNLGRVVCTYKRYPDSNIVAMCLYADEDNDALILAKASKSLEEDFNAKLKNNTARIYHWDDYFGHLDTESLNDHWYDKFDDNFQGKNRTLYVSSGLHMETVGASVEFGTALANQYAEIWVQANSFR